MHFFYIIILIFNISIFWSPEHTRLPTRPLILVHVKHTCLYNRLPEDESSGSRHVADIKKLKIKILI